MSNTPPTISDEHYRLAERIWDYHRMGHELRPVDVAVVLGCHDLGVAACAAKLYQAGFFARMVLTGGNSPSTAEVFPRGEAVHYREHVLDLGVPDEAVLVEPRAANTGQNITLSRQLLAEAGLAPATVSSTPDSPAASSDPDPYPHAGEGPWRQNRRRVWPWGQDHEWVTPGRGPLRS